MGIGDWAQSPIPLKFIINYRFLIKIYLKNNLVNIYNHKKFKLSIKKDDFLKYSI